MLLIGTLRLDQHNKISIRHCRRELDHSEAERLQHIKQLHDLQEHLQDKERQLREVQDQVNLLFSLILIVS